MTHPSTSTTIDRPLRRSAVVVRTLLSASLLAIGVGACTSEPVEESEATSESESALTTPIASGQTVTGISGVGGSWTHFSLPVPVGTTGVKMEYTGTGYCTLRFNENAPPGEYAYTAINPQGIACAGSGTFWNVEPGTLYLALVGLRHDYPLVNGFSNASLKVTLLTTSLPTVTSFTIPSPAAGGTRTTGIVTLSAPAPFPYTVSINDGHAKATAYFNIEFNAGEQSKGIDIFTDPVTEPVSGTFTALSGASSQTATLVVSPTAPPPTSTTKQTLTVTAKGRSGSRVTSSPVGIDVAVGSTRSYGFDTGTSVRLTVSGGRSAIWSGACNSGGSKTTSCTVSMTAAKAVTADVR